MLPMPSQKILVVEDSDPEAARRAVDDLVTFMQAFPEVDHVDSKKMGFAFFDKHKLLFVDLDDLKTIRERIDRRIQREKLSGLHRVLLNKYYVDEFYHAVVVRPLVGGSVFLWKFIDVIVIDGSINGAAFVYQMFSQGMRKAQTGRVRTYATAFVLGVVILVACFVMMD
ncbi:MAG TPA: hypothetical protein PLD93_03735 [Synergistaceae bacterium]|nr:hypothetical protein [Synergistaceae bacterium]